MRPRKRVAMLVLALVLAYLAVAYVIMPAAWKLWAKRHPSLDDIPGITHAADNIPGDPLNVGLIGTESAVCDDYAGGPVIPRRPAYAAQLPENRRRHGLQAALRRCAGQ